MCGIAGILSERKDVESASLQKMADALAHRGPDGQGIWVNETAQVGFAHRRLAIIDLSNAAAQPMHYLNRYTIVYNGEIYNYIELREQLIKLGYHFATKSDTEVILAAYHQYGTGCFNMLDGMFAFAIWDSEREELVAVRDRFGEKPFYYSNYNGVFSFASEMKALWAICIGKNVCNDMLANYLVFGQVQSPSVPSQTFYTGINCLPPAHYLHVGMYTKEVKVQPYWKLESKQINIGVEEAGQKLQELLTNSINKRLRSDVQVGSSLSGGLDSSSIVSIISGIKKDKENFKTFSAVFPGFEKDESKYIELVKDKFGVQNFSITPSAEGLINDFEKLAYHQEEPFPSASIYMQYKVFQLAKEHGIKVLLDGQGADETLSGYTKYIHWFLQELFVSGKLALFNKEKKAFGIDLGIKNFAAAFLPKATAKKLESRELNAVANNPFLTDGFKHGLQNAKHIHKPVVTKLNDMLAFNTTVMGLQELLRFCDRNSMAHGVEVRLPFLNKELVEFVFSLSAEHKMYNGQTKFLLRKIMRGRLPDEIVFRKEKIGFEPPQQQWMSHPTLKEYVMAARQQLISRQILKPEVLHSPVVANSAHEAGNYDWRYLSAAQLFK